MTAHLRFRDKVVNYDRVESWEVISMRGLFGGHSGYALHVQYSGVKKGPEAWDRVAINDSKEVLETLLESVLNSVSGGGIVTIPWDGVLSPDSETSSI